MTLNKNNKRHFVFDKKYFMKKMVSLRETRMELTLGIMAEASNMGSQNGVMNLGRTFCTHLGMRLTMQ